MMKPMKLDSLIGSGMQKAKTVDAILKEIAADQEVRAAVQDAIDNPPASQAQGKPVMGPSHAQHIRTALLGALQATA
jgi:hypothetical protein